MTRAPAAPDAAPGTSHLGYGSEDRFADAQRQLQALLPEGDTDVVEGRHDWPPWLTLWQRWLRRGLLAGAGCGEGRA